MKNTLVLLALVTGIFFAGCQTSGKKSTGQSEPEKNDSTKIIFRHFNDDPNAPIEWKIPMKMNKDGQYVRNGVAIRYLKSGKIAGKTPYVMGKKEGIRYTYHSTGKVYKEQPYVDGQLTGTCKRYDRKGRLTAEYPYKNGLPGMGLKEYTNLGKVRPDPKLTIVKKDEIKLYGKYRLLLSLTGKGTDRIKSVQYYQGPLVEGKYFHKNLQPIPNTSPKKGELVFNIPKGATLNKTINIVAVAKTYTGLKLILQKSVKISVRGV